MKQCLGGVAGIESICHIVLCAPRFENARVMVLAATNRPQELDEAILRRLPQGFEIGLPDCSERAKILKVILKGEKVEHNINYDHIARLCEGYTGSDLLELCKQAAYFPVRDLLHDERNGQASRGEKGPASAYTKGPRLLTQKDLERALQTSRMAKTARSEYRIGRHAASSSRHREQEDDQVQNAISEISRIMSRLVVLVLKKLIDYTIDPLQAFVVSSPRVCLSPASCSKMNTLLRSSAF
ncbi:hypothetical protein ACLOJK_004954 [Asimina triloba]